MYVHTSTIMLPELWDRMEYPQLETTIKTEGLTIITIQDLLLQNQTRYPMIRHTYSWPHLRTKVLELESLLRGIW